MFREASLRRVITWSAILGYALVVSGVPLPLGVVAPAVTDPAAAKRLAGKDRSRPFPCMDKPCGCATAEQCFTNCCCNTPAETLVWAQANRVDPAVIAALQRRAAAPAAAPAASCCSARQQTTCCSATEPSCCATEAPVAPADDASSEEPVAPRTLVLRAMLACGGVAAQWFSIGASLPPPAVVAVVLAAGRVEMKTLVDDQGSLQRAAPAVPPPRVA